MRYLLPLLILSIVPATASAETMLIDVEKLKSKQVHKVALVTPLAVADGKPMIILLDVPAGAVVPPHKTEGGLRLMTVISGDLYWGDGNEIDQSQEKIYPAGSILTLPEQDPHWLAARAGDVRLQLITLDNKVLVPNIQEQMK